MKNKTKCSLILTVLYVAILLWSLVSSDYLIALAASATFFSLSLAVLTNEELDAGHCNRASAMLYAFLPGAAHLYLRQYRRAIAFFGGYLLIAALFFSMAILEVEFWSCFMAFIGIIFAMGFLSIIDTEWLCNQQQLPYTGYAYELKIKNYNLAYFTTILLTYLVGASYSLYVLIFIHVDWAIISIVLGWTIALLIAFFTCIIQKRFSNCLAVRF
ncbi:hypothetical protein [Candidatus Methanomassiliicoccus intestinalis]|uniref:hypothetical protein n=1 Tax=Candidatus Methanomassiliicoccus intestinalis TaxID=1406512 RepID=UPI0037DDCA4C